MSSETLVGEGVSLALSDERNDQNYFVEHTFGEALDWRKIADEEGLTRAKPSNEALSPETNVMLRQHTRPSAFYRLPLGRQKAPHQHHLERFFESIRAGGPSVCSIREGYRTEVVLHRILEAVAMGQTIKLTPADFEF